MASEKKRILVVEDDNNLGRLLQAALTRLGFSVQAVPDGKKALERAEKWQPDLVLLDLDIPVLHGLEVLGQLNARHVETLVVVMSGVEHELVTTVVKAMLAGACDFIQKPIEPAKLAERLSRNLVMESKHRIAGPTPLSEKNRELQASLDDARAQLQTLKRKHNAFELATKLADVGIAAAATILGVVYGGIPAGSGAGVLLFGVLSLLLIPQERLRSITAQWGSGGASVQIDPQVQPEAIKSPIAT